MVFGQIACHHLASAACVICLLVLSSFWLLPFDCFVLSLQHCALDKQLLLILILWFTGYPLLFVRKLYVNVIGRAVLLIFHVGRL